MWLKIIFKYKINLIFKSNHVKFQYTNTAGTYQIMKIVLNYLKFSKTAKTYCEIQE